MMYKALVHFFLFLFLLNAATAQVPNNIISRKIAQKESDSANTYAIVIGISKYKEVPSLKYADRDALFFADYLLDKEGLGLDSSNVKVFLNENATKDNIGEALYEIHLKKAKKGDKVIFFFAGHGDYDARIFNDQSLLLLHRAVKSNYFEKLFSGDFISTSDLNTYFLRPLAIKGCDVILLVDACHATGMNEKLSGGQEGGRVTSMALEKLTSPVKIFFLPDE